MAAEFVKRETNSPKSSPRGSRSPVVVRQDSTGTLRTTITLGKNPAVIPIGPFYLVKEPPTESEITGATSLMHHHGLEGSYNRTVVKKLKEPLSSFLPHLPGNIDTPGYNDNSSLRSLIEKPPICGKEIHPLTQMSGFRLHPGSLPEQYRLMNHQPERKKHHKKHKRELKPGDTPDGAADKEVDASHDSRKHKKQKRHDEDKEKRKKKKEKKKKKKHSPDHPGLSTSNGSMKNL